MKYKTINISRQCRRAIALAAFCVSSIAAMAQVTQVHGTVSDDFGPLMGATICEIDGNGRIIESTVTDMNGNFSMKVKNSEKNKLRVSYVGLKTQTLKFDKTTYDVMMASATTLNEVTVTSKKRMQGNSLPIPDREVSFAKQGISAKDFEGMGISSIDEALQGRIAGLDIVGNSGNLGSGSTMRLRGATSLSSLADSNPLIVVDGNVREVDMSMFDSNSSDMNEQMATLLNINTEDIESLNVLLDGAGAAIYGSQGANGVIEITTKRGKRGKPKLTYTFKLTAKHQPEGTKLLNGDEYTMLLKEAYFNPKQNDAISDIKEINYDPTFSEYEQYNNNTDWVDAVKQIGLLQNHYLTISGGGEKATFRISGGFDNEKATIINQKMSRFSTRVNLDYNVSSRIRVQTNFSMMYTKYNHNYDGDLLSIAQRKMPNMSIYEQDQYGNNTSSYYNMLQSGQSEGSDVFKDHQKFLANPVASSNLAKDVNSQYELNPELVINYELWGMDEDHHRLKWRGSVYMNIFNNYQDRFYPSSLVTSNWDAHNHNTAQEFSSKRVSLTTKQEFTFIPAFKNKDHSVMALARMELSTGSSSSQNTFSHGLPSGGIESPNAGGMLGSMDSGFDDWHNLYFTFSTHYSYKSRYNFDFTLRADGTTKLGPNQRWVYIPAVSLRWNVIDEPFLKKLKESGLVSMISVRPSWSMGAQQPNGYFLYTSKYQGSTNYLGQGAMIPVNLRLNDMKCERTQNINLGFDLGFLNDKVTLAFEVYNNTRTDMLMPNYRIPSNAGYYTIAWYNTGKMRNTGWDFRINTNNIIKKGKFSADMFVNFSNSRSRLLEMDDIVRKGINSTFGYDNKQVLTRVQIDNPLNSIYGFRSKGVYQYNYNTIKEMTITKDQAEKAGIQGWDQWDHMSKEQKQQAWISAGRTAPVVVNEQGQIVRDAEGNPKRMMFNYTNDGSGRNYNFQGGDAIYEDINHDGQINNLDIVYLGSSLPKLTGGFGFTFKYAAWRLTANFNYRVGVDIINLARLDAEAMNTTNNQSQAVNYRWRKEGDGYNEEILPRALSSYGNVKNYNTLISDRFVEDGSYLRLNLLQLNYTLNKKQLKAIGLDKISFYASANNLFVLTKYTGADPDISASMYYPAQDRMQTPRPRSFTFGMTVDF